MVWAGRGASYSWIWWADTLEDLWWLNAAFHHDAPKLEEGLEHADVLLMGGGDVTALSAALDWDVVLDWVSGGGRLVATCAGAYLLSRGRGVGIANAVDEVPERAAERAWTRCSDAIVVHPVRGPVSLRSERGATMTAPLYGGPVFHDPVNTEASVAARYSGATRGTEWLLADRPELVEGTPAVVTVPVGDGTLVLSGPHLEHPDHPAAHLWLAGLLGWEPGEPFDGAPPPIPGTDPGGEEVVRRLASVRRRAASIADRSWRSGDKVWSGERVAGFTERVIPRARALARWGWGPHGRSGGLLPLLEAAADRMGRPRAEDWDQGYAALSEASSLLMDVYFANLRAGMPMPARKPKPPPRLAPEGGFNAPTAPSKRTREVVRR